MALTITEEGIKKNNTNLPLILLLALVESKVSLKELTKKAILESYISPAYNSNNEYFITKEGLNLLSSTITDSISTLSTTTVENRLTLLAKELKNIFPKGKKEGTAFYWSEGEVLIVKRLKVFFRKYDINTYTNEQIIEAAKTYVESFNGDYKYMKLLKYFIFKEVRTEESGVDIDSQLITYIENKGEVDNRGDWTSELV